MDRTRNKQDQEFKKEFKTIISVRIKNLTINKVNFNFMNLLTIPQYDVLKLHTLKQAKLDK